MFVEKVPLKQGEIYSLTNLRINNSPYPYHLHDEYELMVIKGAIGKRFVFDELYGFNNYDMVLFGPNVPHKWQFDKIDNKSVLWVLKFKDIKDNEIFKVPGAEAVNELFNISGGGIYFPNWRDTESVAEMLGCMSALKGINAVVMLLNILDYLSEASQNPIATTNYPIKHTEREIDRIDKIYNFILNRYKEDISLDEISTKFNLSKTGFCTYFKKRTGKSFSEFLNEIRITHAAQALMDNETPIVEIAYRMGYKNLSYFNRRFKTIKGLSPREYRKAFKKEYI